MRDWMSAWSGLRVRTRTKSAAVVGRTGGVEGRERGRGRRALCLEGRVMACMHAGQAKVGAGAKGWAMSADVSFARLLREHCSIVTQPAGGACDAGAEVEVPHAQRKGASTCRVFHASMFGLDGARPSGRPRHRRRGVARTTSTCFVMLMRYGAYF